MEFSVNRKTVREIIGEEKAAMFEALLVPQLKEVLVSIYDMPEISTRVFDFVLEILESKVSEAEFVEFCNNGFGD